MNSPSNKHDGVILISKQGLIYFIILTACTAVIAFVIGYFWCAQDVKDETRIVAHFYMEEFRDSIAVHEAKSDSALVQAGASLAFSKALLYKTYKYTSKGDSNGKAP